MRILQAHDKVEMVWMAKSNNTHQVGYYTENEVTLACPLRFQRYPFDEQICEFLTMDMREPPEEEIKLQKAGLFLGYEGVRKFEPTVRDYQYRLEPSMTEYYTAGRGYNVSTTGFTLRMRRSSFKYFIVYFIPTSKFCLAFKR